MQLESGSVLVRLNQSSGAQFTSGNRSVCIQPADFFPQSCLTASRLRAMVEYPGLWASGGVHPGNSDSQLCWVLIRVVCPSPHEVTGLGETLLRSF
jgi:hypothetical protein